MSYGYPPPSDQPPHQPGQPPQWGQQPPVPPGQYPPQPGWGGPSPVPPPRKTNKAPVIAILGCAGVLVLAVIGGVVALASAGGDSSDDAGSSSVATSPSAAASGKASEKAPAKEKTAKAPRGAEGDVTITGCTVNGATTWPAANVEIVNHSKESANYIISVEFLDKAGTRLGEGMAATNNLAPGQKALEKAQSLSDTKGKITCKVSKVTRYAAP